MRVYFGSRRHSFVLLAELLGGCLLGAENLDPALEDVEHLLVIEARLLRRDLARAGEEQVTSESGEAIQFVTVLQDPFERAFEKLHHLDPRIAHRIGVGTLLVVLVVLGDLVAGGIVGILVLVR